MTPSDGSDDARFTVDVTAAGSRDVDAESFDSAASLAHADWANDIMQITVTDNKTGEQVEVER